MGQEAVTLCYTLIATSVMATVGSLCTLSYGGISFYLALLKAVKAPSMHSKVNCMIDL